MTRKILIHRFVLATLLFTASFASAQDDQRTTALSPVEVETAYTQRIQKRTADIVGALGITDAGKSNLVTDIILRQYRALKARDEVITAALDKNTDRTSATATSLYRAMTPALHQQFVAKLSAELTPEQVDIIKDKMTYDKVKVTYDAYCAIIPNLKDTDKAKIMESLKEAREEAMEGGSAQEKSEIFQKHKDRINDYLNSHGHDVAKAYADWNAKQDLAKQTASPKTTETTK